MQRVAAVGLLDGRPVRRPAEGATSHKRSGTGTADTIQRRLERGCSRSPPKGQADPLCKLSGSRTGGEAK